MFVAGFIGSPSMNFVKGTIDEENELVFQSNGLIFPIPEQLDLRSKLTSFKGQEVVFGFRPEYLYDKNKEQSKRLSVDLSIIIDVVEPIGSESFNYFHFEGSEQTHCFRSDSSHMYRPGGIISAGLDIDRLRFFNASNGKRIA